MASGDSPVFSPDGRWWWSGTYWLPALSPDGRWRWTGQSWVRQPWYEKVPKWFVRDLVVWLGLVTAWVPGLAILAAVKASTSVLVGVGLTLGFVALVSMLALGAKLGRRSMWREVGLSCLAGTAALLAWYAAITIAAPDPSNQNDHAAGVGTVILAVPTLLAVAIVVGLGAVVGAVTRRRNPTG